jgi:FecR protein
MTYQVIVNRHRKSLVMIAAFVSLVAIAAAARGQESFAGVVNGIHANVVKGAVSYQRSDGKFDLEAGLKLEEGDFIRSGVEAYAELLLQPGNYLRVGENSECQIVSDPHDRMKLKLNQGAFTVEILSKDREGNSYFYESLSQRYELIRFITPTAEVFITEPGIFRINVVGRRTDLIVRKGEAVINGHHIKDKRRAMAAGDTVTIVDVDTKIQDDFDAWGRERAEKLIQANRLLKNDSPWVRNRKSGQETMMTLPDDEGQSISTLVVSAKPGMVNFVESGVELSRAVNEWEPVTEESQLEAGDKLRTAEHSFAELTMLPDISLRLDRESEISFEQLSNESISLKLWRGSAILDVARFDRKQAPRIVLQGTSTSIIIADEGNYRIDVRPSTDQITVREGKVTFKEKSVGSCRKIVGEIVSDCEKKRTDNFDAWSEHRGEGQLYNGRATVAMVAHLARLRRLRFKNTGFWFQNPGQPHYTFVPFSSSRFRSPYGGSYSIAFTQHRIPIVRPGVVKPAPRGP